MVAGWGLEPGNSLLYLCWEVGFTLGIHLLFDLQKMMRSVLHAEHGKLMHSGFFICLWLSPLCLLRHQLQQAALLPPRTCSKVCIWSFVFRKRHFLWGKELSWGSEKQGTHHIAGQAFWGFGEDLKATGSCQPSTCPWPGTRESREIKLLGAPLQQCLMDTSLTLLMELGSQKVLLEEGSLCLTMTGGEIWKEHVSIFSSGWQRKSQGSKLLTKARRASQWPKISWTCGFLSAHLSGEVFNIIPTAGKSIISLTAQAASSHHNEYLFTWHLGWKCSGGMNYYFCVGSIWHSRKTW